MRMAVDAESEREREQWTKSASRPGDQLTKYTNATIMQDNSCDYGCAMVVEYVCMVVF